MARKALEDLFIHSLSDSDSAEKVGNPRAQKR